MSSLNLGVLASHGGTNLQAIIDACKDGCLNAQVRVVISNNSRAGALERARNESIPCYHLSGKAHPDPNDLDRTILETLTRHRVSLVVLAGYMKLLGPLTIGKYRGHILNSHPALLPAHGGKGMYGRHVHAAVLLSQGPVTGVTIHHVDEQYDHGPIVARREVPVLPEDTPSSLMDRVQHRERRLWVETLQAISLGSLDLDRSEALTA